MAAGQSLSPDPGTALLAMDALNCFVGVISGEIVSLLLNIGLTHIILPQELLILGILLMVLVVIVYHLVRGDAETQCVSCASGVYDTNEPTEDEQQEGACSLLM